MYTRNFRNFQTDGQLLQLQKEREKELLGELVLPESGAPTPSKAELPAEAACNLVQSPKQGGILGNLLGGIFGNWSFDDLILIGLTLYLLTDKNDGNDLLVILLVLLLT